MTAVRFWASVCMYICVFVCVCVCVCVCACTSVTLYSTACVYCHEHRRARYGWFRRWLIVEGISVKADRKRKQGQGVSEGIKESQWRWCRLAKQRQRMANHRARETGKQRYQQVISIIGSLLSANILVFSCQTSNCWLLASHIVHVLPKRAPRYMRTYVLLHN